MYAESKNRQWVSTTELFPASARSLLVGELPGSRSCTVFPQKVSGMMNSRIKSGKLSKSRSWVSRIELMFFAVMEVSVVLIEIGSFRGSAVGGSTSAESNAWDSSSAPRAGWDAMLDSWERTKLVIESSFLRRRWTVYLSSWRSCSTKSFPSGSFLGCPWNRLALWVLACHDRGSSMGSHQFLQGRCGWSHPWNWAWRLVIYRTPSPI